MKPVRISQARVGDAPIIHALLSEFERTSGATEKVNRSEDDIRRFGFGESPFFEVLLAWHGDEAVGLALYFREFSSWKGAPGVYLQDLYVTTSLRGTGLGGKLIQEVAARARSWDATYCKLSVHGANDAAVAFYKHLGFRVSDTERVLIHNDIQK